MYFTATMKDGMSSAERCWRVVLTLWKALCGKDGYDLRGLDEADYITPQTVNFRK